MSARRSFDSPAFRATGSAFRSSDHPLIKDAMLEARGQGLTTPRVQVFQREIELYADHDPTSPAPDDVRRHAILGCGAVLVALQSGLKRSGKTSRIELFPDLGQPHLLARVRPVSLPIAFSSNNPASLKTSHQASSAGAGWATRPAAPGVTEDLKLAAGNDKSWLDVVESGTGLERLCSLSRTNTPRSFADSSLSSAFPRSFSLQLLRQRLRISVAGSLAPAPLAAGWNVSQMMPETAPTFQSLSMRDGSIIGLLKTKTDDPRGWLAAGQTLGRLSALTRSRRISLVTTVLNSRQAREQLRIGVGRKGFAQAILQFVLPTLDPSEPVSHPLPFSSSERWLTQQRNPSP